MASDQTINTIAKALGEADEGPLAQIKAVVDNLGDQACLTLLAETEKIEKAGGLMRGDGSGRRSAGGVFFFLARQRLPRDIRAAIFNDKKPRDPNAPKSAPAAAKPAPAGAHDQANARDMARPAGQPAHCSIADDQVAGRCYELAPVLGEARVDQLLNHLRAREVVFQVEQIIMRHCPAKTKQRRAIRLVERPDRHDPAISQHRRHRWLTL